MKKFANKLSKNKLWKGLPKLIKKINYENFANIHQKYKLWKSLPILIKKINYEKVCQY